MPGRKYSSVMQYRYGFNGKEEDDEVKGDGNQQDYGMRIYDPRLGRWHSTDIHIKPYLSSYSFSKDDPIDMIDPDGNDEIHFHYVTILIPTAYKNANGSFTISAKPVKYTWVEVIKDNLAPTLYVHKDIVRHNKINVSKIEYVKDKGTQFFPSTEAFGSPSTGITYSTFIGIDYKDDDYTALLKIMDDFPDLQGKVFPYVFQTPNSRNINRDFWSKVFSDKRFRSEAEAQKKRESEVVINIIGIVTTDILLAEITNAYRAYQAAKAGLKIESSVGSVMGEGYRSVSEVTAEIKNMDVLAKLNASSEGQWVKVYEAGLQNGTKVEVHYFRNNATGQVFDVKTKYNFWHQKQFKKIKL